MGNPYEEKTKREEYANKSDGKEVDILASAVPAYPIADPMFPLAVTRDQAHKIWDILEGKPRKVAKFEKISFEQWKESLKEQYPSDDELLKNMLEDLHKPMRSTEGSAGYDFFMPFNVMLNPGNEIVIPTGIRVKMNSNFVLKIYPRSGLGFKYKVRFANTVGIIDSDYYFANNEGHIMISLSNNTTDKVLKLYKGDKFCQGIFVEYGITEDDDEDTHEKRTGGMGSTGR